MAAAGPSNAFQHARSPLMEASIKMAEQLAPNRRSDRGRMHGLADEGFDAGQARFLKLTAITHPRFSSPLWSGDEVRKAPRDCRDRAGRGALAMVHVRPKRPSTLLCRERWRGCARR